MTNGASTLTVVGQPPRAAVEQGDRWDLALYHRSRKIIRDGQARDARGALPEARRQLIDDAHYEAAAEARLREQSRHDALSEEIHAVIDQAAGPDAALPRRVPGRAFKVAAIRSYADWLEAHPEIPMPDVVYGRSHWESAETVEALAAAAGVLVKGSRRSRRWVELPLTDEGVKVTHTVFVA